MRRFNIHKIGLALLCLFSTICFNPVFAQNSTRLPAGTTERENRDKLESISEPKANYSIEKPSASGMAPNSQIRFKISKFNIVGSSVISIGELERGSSKYLGNDRGLDDIKSAADAITKIYSDKGYALSFAIVPVQNVENGVVTIRVVEGSIDKIDIEIKNSPALTGSSRFENAIRARFDGLINSGPVKLNDIERALLTSSDWGGVDLRLIVRPSDSVENAATLIIVADYDPLSYYIQGDNRMRQEFGDYRYNGRLNLNSTLLVGDSLIIDARSADTSEGFRSGFFSYSVPLFQSDAMASISYSKADTKAQNGLLSLLDFESSEQVVRAEIKYPLLRTRSKSIFISAGLSAIESQSGILSTTLIHDNVRNLELASTWDWAGKNGSNGLLRIGILQGIDGLGASDQNNPLRSRTQGKPDFFALTSDFNWFQRFPASKMILSFDAATQMGTEVGALAANECSYGGQQFGRAYDPGAFGGENCIKASLELARTFSNGGFSVQPYAFIDGGAVSQNGALDFGETRSSSAYSGGFGFRFALPYGIRAETYAAWPSESDFARNGSDEVRIFFTLGIRR